MLCIVAYDIVNDGTRTQIANELENWGSRVQYSVFECDLTERRTKELSRRLARYLAAGDSIRIYRLCEACRERTITHGGKPVTVDKKFYQV